MQEKFIRRERSIKVWLLPYLVSNFPLDTELIENYVLWNLSTYLRIAYN